MYLVTAREMQQMDHETIHSFGLPGRVLMENAGLAATGFMRQRFPDIRQQKVGVVAGSGNNGGDGFVMARYLSQMDIAVTVYLLTKQEKISGDAKANLDLLGPLGIPVIEIADNTRFKKHKPSWHRQDIWIDAILGTGLKSDVRGYYRDVIAFINQLNKPVLAVDIPSGIDSDTGQIRGIGIRAAATATFGFPKIGHVQYPGADYTGDLKVVDIGIPGYIAEKAGPRQYLLTKDMIESSIQPRSPDMHKGGTGHLLVISGSPGKTGAAAMTAVSAMRAGAGLVTLGIPEGLNPVLESQVTEAMTYALPETHDGVLDSSGLEAVEQLVSGKKCLAIGPGIGTAAETKELLYGILRASRIPVVVDADGLNLIAHRPDLLKELKAPIILTPHPGEMGRLCGMTAKDVQADRIGCARHFAESYGVHLVLKGAGSVIAHPDGRVFVNPTGNSGMASGGMGDVLTGIIAGFVTQGYSPEEALHAGVWLHGAAADSLALAKGPFGYLATEVMDQIPDQIRKVAMKHHPSVGAAKI